LINSRTSFEANYIVNLFLEFTDELTALHAFYFIILDVGSRKVFSKVSLSALNAARIMLIFSKERN